MAAFCSVESVVAVPSLPFVVGGTFEFGKAESPFSFGVFSSGVFEESDSDDGESTRTLRFRVDVLLVMFCLVVTCFPIGVSFCCFLGMGMVVSFCSVFFVVMVFLGK